MAKYYYIEKLNKEKYPYIIFSKSYISPIEDIESLELDLQKIGAKGKIIFDLLLSNGDSPDRYFEADFDGRHLDRKSFRQVNSISKKVKQISNKYYHNNLNLLKNSVLSKAQKFLIKNKIQFNY